MAIGFFTMLTRGRALRFYLNFFQQTQASLKCSQTSGYGGCNVCQTFDGRDKHQHRCNKGDESSHRGTLHSRSALNQGDHQNGGQGYGRHQLGERRHGS